MRRTIRASLAMVFGFAASLIAADAHAALCSESSVGAKRVYAVGSTAAKPLLKVLGQKYYKDPSTPFTVVYVQAGSCNGAAAIINGTTVPTGTATYWDDAGNVQSCTLDPNGIAADLGVSDVFAEACPQVPGIPQSIADFRGPNQVMTFVVPTASPQKSISADAGYFVFGFGGASGFTVWPWTDPTQYFIRNSGSGTQTMLGKAIGVPATRWLGVDTGSSTNVVSKLKGASSPSAAIGILAADLADANRDALRILAFKAQGQTCGYLPDSSASAFDKSNVRDGHYAVWGPLHFYAKVDANGVPTNANVKTLTDFIAPGTNSAASEADLTTLYTTEIQSYTVPQCAMRVSRASEMGAMSPYKPAKACGCLFDKVATGTTTCAACSSASPCKDANKVCNFGYCEDK